MYKFSDCLKDVNEILCFYDFNGYIEFNEAPYDYFDESKDIVVKIMGLLVAGIDLTVESIANILNNFFVVREDKIKICALDIIKRIEEKVVIPE